ncbi:hypothetical protein PBT90_02840 [Algoriphagus halophytocola]|uniref:hypothetical protein n=1 Tax=Algoriphagus halophytocola TaxID=2991499 RepID=UPI0022DD5B66|nr:hypothetical protein [Algoriphagus sp. TR-M9]WBL43625.1 hypothetical protein PBT90_02840 [Algoriphagus sp. TR-M9]
MNTKLIMTSSAILLWAAGLILTFTPDFVLKLLSLAESPASMVAFQVIGALYFGFGMLNWMSKGGLIGGIYNRPIAIANFSHFMIAGFALIKNLSANPESSPVLWGAGIIYSLYAVCFAIIVFRHPLPKQR